METRPMSYDVAIITVSTDKLDEACLASVGRIMRTSALRIGFVVVDNGSSTYNATARVYRHVPNAIVIHRYQNHGFGRSCNRGAEEIDANYYFFLNPDTDIQDAGIVERLHAFMRETPKAGIVAPLIRYPDGRLQETCRRFPKWYTPLVQRLRILSDTVFSRHQREFVMRDFDHASRRMVDWVQGSAFMIDGKLWDTLGGFDHRFWMYYEDVDLCRRAWAEGRPVYYLPDVELFHTYGKESAKEHNVVKNVLVNQKARTHILSWIKYTLKWL